MAMLYLVSFGLGLTIGSFLNVCVHRIPRGLSLIGPSSHCPHCNHTIGWLEKVPVISFLFLRGRCRSCQARIPRRYPALEMLTGAIFTLIAWVSAAADSGGGIGSSTWLAWTFASLLIVSAAIDLEWSILPDEVNLCGVVLAILFASMAPSAFPFASPELGQGSSSAIRSLTTRGLGLVAGLGFTWTLRWIGWHLLSRSRLSTPGGHQVVLRANQIRLSDNEEQLVAELLHWDKGSIEASARDILVFGHPRCPQRVRITSRAFHLEDFEIPLEPDLSVSFYTESVTIRRQALGMGDVKLMGMVGAFLGPSAVPLVLVSAALLGLLSAVPGIIPKKSVQDTRIPFGPSISVAALTWLLVTPRFFVWGS